MGTYPYTNYMGVRIISAFVGSVRVSHFFQLGLI